MDQRTRKLIMIRRALHSERWQTDNVSRKEGGRGLTSIEDSIDALIQGLKDCIKKCKERLITVTTNSTDTIKIKRTTITRKWKSQKNNYMDISSNKLYKSYTGHS